MDDVKTAVKAMHPSNRITLENLQQAVYWRRPFIKAKDASAIFSYSAACF